jgi:PAT family beta-lactamase induction signal transducer AmpG
MAIPILIMVAGFRMPGYISSAMAFPLFKSLHYSNSDIATVTKLFGFWVALAGTFSAGYLVPRIGLMASLVVGTVFASASHLSLAYLAVHGDHGGGEFWLFAVTVSIDSFAYAFASIVLITYMSTLTSTEHAASQYALLTSLCAFPGSILAGASGFLIERMSFEWFFAMTSLIGMPVAILAWYLWQVDRKIPAQVAS